MPTIVSGSISILSDAGLGMAMFSLGEYIYFQFCFSLLVVIILIGVFG